MSTNLDLLSDSTFGTKMDTQNGILEDIKDALGGGGDAASAGSIATIETSPAATAHTVGEYIYYNTKLYKVIAAIALGDTLTVGTNIAETKVMDEISAGGAKYLVPKSYEQASAADDFFVSTNPYYNNGTPVIANYYYIFGKTIQFMTGAQNATYYGFHLWLKQSAFNISTTADIEEHFAFIMNTNTDLGHLPIVIKSRDLATNYTGYAVVHIEAYTSSNVVPHLKIMYI